MSLQDGHRVVLAALSDFKVAHDEKFRFEFLIESIKPTQVNEDRLYTDQLHVDEVDEAALWEYRAAAMSLINAVTNSPEDIEERVMLRNEFGRRALNEVMTVSLCPY